MLDLKEIKSAIEDQILKTEALKETKLNISIFDKKQEKFGTSSITIESTVYEDKDGNEIEAFTSTSLYMIEREGGANLIIINNDRHDISFNKYAKTEYIEEVVTNTIAAVVRTVEGNVKRAKGIMPERKPNNRNNNGGKFGNKNRQNKGGRR